MMLLNKIKKYYLTICLHLFLMIFSFFAIIPLLWMISTSFKRLEDVFVYPPKWIPSPFDFEGYYILFTQIPYGRQFLNSVGVCLIIVIGQLICSSMGAYAFAKLRFPGRDKLFILFLATMMVTEIATLIPSYVLMYSLGWINTYMALIGPFFLGSAYATFLLRQFIMTIPRELEESAIIDGAGFFTIYFRIILPLCKPALAALFVFGFCYFWNGFLWPMIVINSDHLKIVNTGIISIAQGYYGLHWPALMAGATLTVIPLIIIFFAAQRFFVEGITITGIKA